jgi:iron complex outermembrane receptor protein
MTKLNRSRLGLLAGIAAGAILTAMPACAQAGPSTPIEWELSAQPLGDALVAIGKASGIEVMFTSQDVAGKRAPALRGTHSAQNAVALLIRDSGLVAEWQGATVTVRRPGDRRADVDDGTDIIVTGSRIRGAPPASPVIRVTAEDMRNAGQSDLGQALRSIPQNFSGGQNPGVGGGSRGGENANVNSASSPNLRGLGPDATLTLLNGRRLAYGGVQNAIDLSAIPLDAVDRVEVVADGASALYGSDAVAGVVNIILKKSYDGVSVSGRWGAATDGGDVERQYSATAGTQWGSGGIIAAIDWSRNSAILARHRDYAGRQDDSATLYPSQNARSGLISVNQAFGHSGVSFSADLLYNLRRHRVQAPFAATGPYDFYGTVNRARSERFSIAPQLTASLGGWSLGAGLVHAEDRARLSTIFANGGADQYDTRLCLCNRLTSGEINADGALLDLPAGRLRLALGAGYRRNGFDQQRRRVSFIGGADQVSAFSAAQESWYGYAELFAPLVSPEMDVSWLDRLSFSAAVRYENYGGMGDDATPKLGLVASPVPGVTVSASWGKSFKAPTLYQQFLDQQTLLLNSGTTPTGSAMLYLSGGNSDLKPERSSNWTATVAIEPTALPGWSLEASYFDISYSERVIEPIASTTGVLTSAAYAPFVILAPTRAQIDEAIAAAPLGLNNLTGRPYDPALVVGIVDNRFTNVSRQRARGVDIAARYRAQFENGAALTVSAGASYIDSRRRLIDAQPYRDVSGTIFNIPHWRARGGAVFEQGGLSLSGWVTRIGGVTDDRTAMLADVAGQTLIDLILRYRTRHGRGLTANMEFALSAQNILNNKPATIRTDQVSYTPFDSTNYSAIGRFVGLTISKRWQ